MKRIEWTDALSVGISEIDAQHKRIIEMINELADAAQGGKDLDLKAAVSEFTDYTKVHFVTEEKYMDRFCYAGYDAHIEEHMLCSMKAVEFVSEFLAGDESLLENMVTYLREWFVSHISGTDKELGRYLTARGVR